MGSTLATARTISSPQSPTLSVLTDYISVLMVHIGSFRHSMSARAGRCVVRRASAAHRLALYGLPSAKAVATELDEHVEALARAGKPACRIAICVSIAALRLVRYRISDGITTSLPAAVVLMMTSVASAHVVFVPRGDGIPSWLYALIAVSSAANGIQLAANPSQRPSRRSWRANVATLGLLCLLMAFLLDPMASTDWGLRSSTALVGLGFLWIGLAGPQALGQGSSLVSLGAAGTTIGNLGTLALDFGFVQTVNAIAIATAMFVGIWASWRLKDVPQTSSDARANTNTPAASPPMSAHHTFFVAAYGPRRPMDVAGVSQRPSHWGRVRR
jgi:hypothetical protein